MKCLLVPNLTSKTNAFLSAPHDNNKHELNQSIKKRNKQIAEKQSMQLRELLAATLATVVRCPRKALEPRLSTGEDGSVI